MQGNPPRKPKIVFSLETPYTDVQWPVISADDQTKILDMLCSPQRVMAMIKSMCFASSFQTLVPKNSKADLVFSRSLLSPIGEHRSRNVAPSKGKRAKKRKRKDDPTIKDQSADFSEGGRPYTAALPRPEMHDHLTIGFNTTTRYLELLAQKSIPSTDEHKNSDAVVAIKTSARPSLDPANKTLAAVFVSRSGQPSVLYSQLPFLTKAASLAVPSSPSTRIISLPQGAEDRLKIVLGIPRVGIIGLIDGAPNAASFIELIRQNVPELEVPWLQEAVNGAYLPVKVNAIQTSAPLRSNRGARSPILAIAPGD